MYRSSFSVEEAVEVEDGYWTWYCDVNKVKAEINNSINYLLDRLSADKYKLCLSDTYNFRKDISTEYKGKRAKVKKPLALKPIRQWILEKEECVIYPSLEGDDVMGILATDPNKEDDTIIVSGDKDMFQIPGKLWKDDILHEITQEQADYQFYMQTITGDVTDGYSGIRGTGPAKAAKILGLSPNWNDVRNAYESAGLSEDECLKQARMARILRSGNWDAVEQKPILWSS